MSKKYDEVPSQLVEAKEQEQKENPNTTVEFDKTNYVRKRHPLYNKKWLPDLSKYCRFFYDICERWMPWCPCVPSVDANAIDEPPPNRYIYCGREYDDQEQFIRPPRLETEEESEFCDNYISTTKYTILTFLPTNLFEQFLKKANFYFLIVAALSFTDISPKSPVFSVAPLTFVLTVSAVKEAYEDYKRYEMDKEVNNRQVKVFRPENDESGKNWKFRDIAWKEVEVGDIVKITKEEKAFPADILLLQSSTNQGLCNIETANLDGETNLKIKQAVGATYSIPCSKDGEDYCFNPKLNFCLISEAPNEKMDKSSWKGALEFKNQQQQEAVGMNQLLLRGCTLRNTDWIIGLVVFTGIETKLMLNNKSSAFKRSNVDLIVDKALYIIFIAQASLCMFGAIAHYIWLSTHANDEWYQYITYNGSDGKDFGDQAVLNYFTFLVLLDLFVPISLYVSMELVKFTQAWLINQDKAMIDEETKISAKARTSNLNEELGQVGFIFSDKTGTLTENKMEFIKCHIDGVRYGPGEMERQHEFQDKIPQPEGLPPVDNNCRFTDNRLAHKRNNPTVNEFLTLLSVCHSIIPEYPDAEKKEAVIYQASSPDEKALVIFAKNMYYYFYDAHVQIQEFGETKIDGHRFYVNIHGEEHLFDVYHMLEFSSARKRMSVIVKDPRDNGSFKLYCKGADNVIFDRLKESERETAWPSTLESLKTFSTDGLRTLVCGYRILDENQYKTWLNKYLKAKASLTNRDELVDECYEEIERDFLLLGATAIEDRLQDGVPDTIANLAVAGVNIWVLTGDKVETAINIGRSCRLLTSEMIEDDNSLIVIDPDEKLDNDTAKEKTEELFKNAWDILEKKKNSDPKQGLVISGKALSYVFPHRKRDSKGREIPPSESQLVEEARLQELVLNMCKKCRAVICCRVSPKQKAQMVLLVKLNVAKTITLAIGDGANDVPMIKAAHVGIGISGQEGLQAVMASDYSIALFKFLKDLLLVHGAWDYRRISILILYSFYKNIAFSMTQIWYSFYCGFSGTLFYDAFSGSCYNMVFTAFPILFAAVLDRPYSKEIAKLCPELYDNGPKNGSFNLKIFLVYVLEGVLHSCIIFYLVVFFVDSSTKSNGQVMGFWVSTTALVTALVSIVTLKIMIETKTWTKWSVLIFFCSLLSWFVFALVWSSVPLSLGWGNNSVYKVVQQGFSLPQFWFSIMLAAVVCLVPEILLRYVLRMERPSRLNVIEELEKSPKKREKFLEEIGQHIKKIQQINPIQAAPSAHSQRYLGFAEFQISPDHPDFVMTQEDYMHATLRKQPKLVQMLFKKKKTKDPTKSDK